MGSLEAAAGPGFVGIVCGLASEAAAIRRGLAAASPRLAVRIAVSGADADQAEALARDYCEHGAGLLVSAGLAGGLAPSLKVGDVVWATDVVSGDPSAGGRYPCVPAVREAGGEAGPGSGFHAGPVAGVDAALTTPARKAAVWRQTGAIAADMESHRMALVAAAAGVPLLVVRSIVDDAATELPAFVHHATLPSGRPRLGVIIAHLVRRPWQLPALVTLARASAVALTALQEKMPAVARTAEALRNASVA